ncbi:uncharacterized protein LOC124915834 [Impatiens glandulifera]|uniref:uncharacterized protein LOC124915834 n=1 Tax=Impatiens glandulifera TaxID=253017 RepID=UPI001FB079A9|nr:uncharacterized protein LOC124915834 [Impatiens glandulifera]
MCNLINASPKRHAELHSSQRNEIAHMVVIGERDTGRGCNQIGNLLRPGKTRWSSNFDSLCSMVYMYAFVITVLENMVDEGSFDFIFILHLMQKIMGLTNLLCRALQERSLDILNAMDHVSNTKTLSHALREQGFDILLSYVEEVCEKYDIKIPRMEARYKSSRSRSSQQKDSITVKHHYQFDVFVAAIDFQIEELNSRFQGRGTRTS